MSRKTPADPPPQASLARAMLVPILIFAGVLVLALLIGVLAGGPGGDSAGDSAGTAQDQTLAADTMERFENEWDELGVAIGPADAPVTVREFADYQCPACASFAGTAKRLREEYVASGKARFIFFDFPLPIHDHARTAAIAARCAARQNAYWAFHERLFANQQAWSQQADPVSDFMDYAVAAGAQAEPLRRCVEQAATGQVVSQNAEIARTVGVASTPTVLVGSRVFSGVTDYQTLAREIESQIAAADSGP